MMDYIQSPLNECVTKVYEDGCNNLGFDSTSDVPEQRGLDDVIDYVADYTLSAILAGLGIDVNSPDFRKILSAYVDGKQKIDPADFVSAINRGQNRKITW